MTDANLLGAQLYARLAELLAPPGSLDGTASVLLVEPCGRDLDPADFGTDPDGAGAEAFADLVNAVPVPGATFVDSGRRLDDVAGLVLLNAATDPTASLAAATLVEQARADLALMARGSATFGDVYHPAKPTPGQFWDTSAPWAPVSFTLGSTAAAPTPPPPEILPMQPPPLVWTTCPTVEVLPDPTVRLAATGRLSLSRLAKDVVLTDQVRERLVARPAPEPDPRPDHPARRLDHVLLDRRVLLAPTALRARVDELGEVRVRGRVDDPGADPDLRRPVRFRDLQVAHQLLVEQAPTAPVAPPASGFDLSFSYRVVTIERPWWHPELFLQPGWTMPGFAAGAVSTGTSTGNPGLLGAVTTRMLLVRDLVVRGSWSTADAATAAAAQQEFGTLGLGPFSLTGDVGWDGVSLTRPGLQVVAWLGVVTPPFPPAA